MTSPGVMHAQGQPVVRGVDKERLQVARHAPAPFNIRHGGRTAVQDHIQHRTLPGMDAAY